MKVIERKVSIGKKQYIITKPESDMENITGLFDYRKDVMVFADNNGYSILEKYFLLASNSIENDIFYIPVNFKGDDEFKDIFDSESDEYNLSIVIVNYNCVQLNSKELVQVLKSKNFVEEQKQIELKIDKDYNYDYWEIKDKLTVKKYSKFLIIYANKEMLRDLAMACRLMFVEDKYLECSNFNAHVHRDSIENTYKSLGLTFRFWQSL